MIDCERPATPREVEQARRNYRRVSLDLDRVDAAIARWEGGRDEPAELLVFWYARRAELLRMKLDAAERAAAIYAALYVPSGTHDLVKEHAD